MATATLILPAPPSNAGKNWQKAWQAYQASPTAGYAAYYNFLKGGSSSGPLLAAGNYPVPGSAGAPDAPGGGTGTGGTGGTITPPPGSNGFPTTIPGIGNYPAPTGVNITQPAGDPYGAAARFGGVPGGSLDPLNYRIYTGNMVTSPQGATGAPGTTVPPSTSPLPTTQPPPTTTPVPTPSPTPVPAAPGGVSAPGAGTEGQPPRNGFGNGFGGNEGGARQADRGLSFGNGGGASSGMRLVQGPDGQRTVVSADQASQPGYIDLGPVGNSLLGAAATLAPGWAGVGLGALQAAGRLYNTSVTDSVRQEQGLPALDFGQWLGGAIGGNGYGSMGGNPTIANPGQYGDLQRQIDAKQLGTDPFASLFKTNTLGAPTAETLQGGTYEEGPGGILGWIGRGLGVWGEPTGAASYQDTQDQLSGQEAVKQLAAETGLSLTQAKALLDRDKPGNAAGGNSARGLGLGGAPLSGQSAAQVNRYGGATAQEANASVGATTSQGKVVGFDANGDPVYGGTNKAAKLGLGGNNSGFAQSGNDRSALGPGTGSNPGGGTTAPGSAGTGGLNNGFGGGGYARGGFVRGRPDAVPDNRNIRANEGEFVLANQAADAFNPTVLRWLNNAGNAAKANAILAPFVGRGGPKGPADLRPPMPFTGDRQAISPQAVADLFAAMDAEAGRGPAPPRPGPMDPGAMSGPSVARFLPPPAGAKPPQPLPDRTTGDVPMMTGVEGGWPFRVMPASLAVNISGSGHPAAKAKSKGKSGPSESDILNRQQLTMILARRAAQQAAGRGMRFGA